MRNLLIMLSVLVATSLAPAMGWAQAEEPITGSKVGGNMDAMSMILALLMVLVLIVISAMVLKRFQGGTSTGSGLKVITSLSLGAKERLMVVQVGQQQILLGVTAQQISVLEKLDQPLAQGTMLSSDLASGLIGKSVLKMFKKTS